MRLTEVAASSRGLKEASKVMRDALQQPTSSSRADGYEQSQQQDCRVKQQVDSILITRCLCLLLPTPIRMSGRQGKEGRPPVSSSLCLLLPTACFSLPTYLCANRMAGWSMLGAPCLFSLTQLEGWQQAGGDGRHKSQREKGGSGISLLHFPLLPCPYLNR